MKLKKFPGQIKKAIKSFLITQSVIVVIAITLLSILIFSFTEAISLLVGKATDDGKKDLYNVSKEFNGDPVKYAEDNLCQLNIAKVYKYMDVERSSVPNEIKGYETTTKDKGYPSKKQITLDVSSYVGKYKIPWQFIGATDIAYGKAMETEDTTVVNAAKKNLTTDIEWATDKYSVDKTSYLKTWEVTTKSDPNTDNGKFKEIKKTKEKETETKVSTPLNSPLKATTPFGVDTYVYTENVVKKNENWSKPMVIDIEKWSKEVPDKLVDDTSKPIYENKKKNCFKAASNRYIYTDMYGLSSNELHEGDKFTYYKKDNNYYYFRTEPTLWIFYSVVKIPVKDIDNISNYNLDNWEIEFRGIEDTNVFTGRYKKKQTYRTVKYEKKKYKRTKEKVVEDVLERVDSATDFTKLAAFLSELKLDKDDLKLIKETTSYLPESNDLVNKIGVYLDEDLGDVNLASGGGDSGDYAISSASGGFPLFNQYDSKWKDKPFGSSTIGPSGCGPTTMAVMVNGLCGNITPFDYNKDNIVTPDEIAKWGGKYYISGAGSSHELFSAVATAGGLSCRQGNPDEVYKALKEGKPVVASMHQGHFTKGGHIMGLVGVDDKGLVEIRDSGHIDTNKKNWNFNIIKSEADGFWILDNPNFGNAVVGLATAYYSFTFEDAALTPEDDYDIARLEGGNAETASGLNVSDKDLRDRIIATDSRFQFKTKLHITFPKEVKQMKMPDGTVVKTDGFYSVEDRGGAILGNHIDVYMGAWKKDHKYRAMCDAFGKRSITIRFRKS